MKNLNFKFYSVLKNEDADPYIGDDLIVAADGLGGSGSAVHAIDRVRHADMRADIMSSAYGDIKPSPAMLGYIEDLIAPMVDGKDDTSALWASRIVIARCVYALTEGEFKNCDLSDKKTRERLAEFIQAGLCEVAKKFGLQNGKYDGQLLLPTTLSFMRYTEAKYAVTVETLWAGDSRCYALTPSGLKVLSVDDEDGSGSITNLFYANNKKVALNYISHRMEKPCALFAVSDGVFDPFDPHDHLGVEHTLLSAIRDNHSPEGVAEALKRFYGEVHADDVTMAFVAFGFDDFADLQKRLAQRTDNITAIRQEQARLYSALEVMDQSEDDASHYVAARTGDRYDHIATLLVEAAESGAADIAVTPEVKAIVEGIQRDCAASAERAKKQSREKGLADLYEYVTNNPQLIAQILVPCNLVDFGNNYIVFNAFSDIKKYAGKYVAAINNEEILSLEKQLDKEKEELHIKVKERIDYYREQTDLAWFDKTSDYKRRYNINKILQAWQNIDFCLQYNWGLSDIGTLPEAERALAYQVRDFTGTSKSAISRIKSNKSDAENSYSSYMKAWNTVYEYLKNSPTAIPVLLTEEAVHQFGFDVSDESFAAELGKGKRDRILYELKAQKDIVVPAIVKALATNYDNTSVIDGQYNATKLELFRTYYRLKVTDDGSVKAFEKQLADLEAGYTSLVAK